MMGNSTSDESVTSYDPFYDRCGAELSFAWFPHRCALTNKLIWLTVGYRLTSVWMGPGSDVVEHRWHNKLEHIFWKLKR